MPWPYYTMPSIQISVLKAYLSLHGIDVAASHFHLEVAHWLGYKNYNAIWGDFLEDGESLYGYLLFPEQQKKVLASENLLNKRLEVNSIQRLKIPSIEFFSAFDTMHDDYLSQFDWQTIRLVGFTLNFGQTLASIYLASKIKRLNPKTQIIFGGAEASGELGVSLLNNFPEIDYVCNGEGEKPLLNLASWLIDNTTSSVPPFIRGIINRTEISNLISLESVGNLYYSDQIRDISNLPCPDFEDYFDVIQHKLDGDFSICSTLPLETSRGCYYSCNFCALNLQWENFRSVSAQTTVLNIKNLSKKYQILEYFFVDNITPPNILEICNEIVSLGLDLSSFYEVRANLSLNHFQALKKAGVIKVQLGIEAFSSSLLKKFNKKTTTIYNLQGLKNCYQLGITVLGNLILDYPFADASEVEESLRNIDLAMAYPPTLSFSVFALEVGAPDFRDANAKNIQIIGNYPLYKRAYPEKLLKNLSLPRKEFYYDSDSIDWSPVQLAFENWKANYAYMQQNYGNLAKPLTYRDGQTFIIIQDLRFKKRKKYRLSQLYRDIYLIADQVTYMHKIIEALPNYNASEIQDAIKFFVSSKLMAQENDRVLSLAVR